MKGLTEVQNSMRRINRENQDIGPCVALLHATSFFFVGGGGGGGGVGGGGFSSIATPFLFFFQTHGDVRF